MAKKVRVTYGMPGHEGEWVVNIEGFNLKQFIPMVISDDLEEELLDQGADEFTVMNRGSRIEVITDDASTRMQFMILDATCGALARDGFV
jgi:hypothetical protein